MTPKTRTGKPTKAGWYFINRIEFPVYFNGKDMAWLYYDTAEGDVAVLSLDATIMSESDQWLHLKRPSFKRKGK